MNRLKLFLAENFFVVSTAILLLILAFTLYNTYRKPRNQAPEIIRALMAAAKQHEQKAAEPETTKETPVVPITQPKNQNNEQS